MWTVCIKAARPRLGASTHSLLHFSDLTPPLALLRFCLPLSLSLSRLRLAARSSAEIHPLSLKFSASWLFRSDKNRGLIRAEIKADWRHSCILPLLHLATLTIPSSFLRPVVWSWMFNRKQSFEGALFAARTQTQTFSIGRTLADFVCPWFRNRGRLFYVPVCVSVHVWRRGCVVMVEVWPGLYFHSCLLSPMITQNAFTPWQPWGLLSLLSHTRGGREGGRQSWDYGCEGVCLCICALGVCLCRKRRTGGGEKKIYLTCWQSSIFKNTPTGRKKNRGKNNKPKKNRKNNPPAYILSLLLLKLQRHPFVENKSERGYDTNSPVANLFIKPGDSNGIREIRGNHIRKIHKSLRREEPVFLSYNATAEEDTVRSATQHRSVL